MKRLFALSEQNDCVSSLISLSRTLPQEISSEACFIF
jgi:hypothetical protein